MVKYEVKIDVKGDLEQNERNEEPFNGPLFHQGVIELNHLLDALSGENIVLIC